MATRTSILAWRIMDRGDWWSTVRGGPWGCPIGHDCVTIHTHTQLDGIAQRLSICLEGHVLPTVESKWNLELSRNEDPFEHHP